LRIRAGIFGLRPADGRVGRDQAGAALKGGQTGGHSEIHELSQTPENKRVLKNAKGLRSVANSQDCTARRHWSNLTQLATSLAKLNRAKPARVSSRLAVFARAPKSFYIYLLDSIDCLHNGAARHRDGTDSSALQYILHCIVRSGRSIYTSC